MMQIYKKWAKSIFSLFFDFFGFFDIFQNPFFIKQGVPLDFKNFMLEN